MTELKLTDEEVIKDLEHAMYSAKGEDGFKELHWEMLKDFLDLINRQKAEIESLKDLIIRNDEKHLSYTARLFKEERERIQIESTRRLEAEIERLNFENLQMVASIKRLKSEAIKEFAERLCEGRVSNDPIVIAVKSEIKLMEENK